MKNLRCKKYIMDTSYTKNYFNDNVISSNHIGLWETIKTNCENYSLSKEFFNEQINTLEQEVKNNQYFSIIYVKVFLISLCLLNNKFSKLNLRSEIALRNF